MKIYLRSIWRWALYHWIRELIFLNQLVAAKALENVVYRTADYIKHEKIIFERNFSTSNAFICEY